MFPNPILAATLALAELTTAIPRIDTIGLPVGIGRGTSCMPACGVYLNGEQGCKNRIDFVGPCHLRNKDTTRPAGKCKGIEVRWIVDGNGGAGTLDIIKDKKSVKKYKVGKCGLPKSRGASCTYTGGDCPVE